MVGWQFGDGGYVSTGQSGPIDILPAIIPFEVPSFVFKLRFCFWHDDKTSIEKNVIAKDFINNSAYKKYY
jgi:hypothetical protein